jgi:hypothetical protein
MTRLSTVATIRPSALANPVPVKVMLPPAATAAGEIVVRTGAPRDGAVVVVVVVVVEEVVVDVDPDGRAFGGAFGFVGPRRVVVCAAGGVCGGRETITPTTTAATATSTPTATSHLGGGNPRGRSRRGDVSSLERRASSVNTSIGGSAGEASVSGLLVAPTGGRGPTGVVPPGSGASRRNRVPDSPERGARSLRSPRTSNAR